MCRSIESDDAARAFDLYKGACDLFEIDNKEYYGLDTFRQAMAAAIKANKYVSCFATCSSCLCVG